MSPSRVSYPDAPSTKASVGLRVCLVLLGVCVVVGTAGAIIINASEDGPRGAATKPVTSAGVGAAGATPVPPAPAPLAPPASVAAPDPGPGIATPPGSAKPIGSAKPKPASSAPPAGLKGVAVPPNPFGGAGGKPLPAKRK
jgi:hypothetical protein